MLPAFQSSTGTIYRASALLRQQPLSSSTELDQLLPAGTAQGSLVDLHADEAVGALALALKIAAEQQRRFPTRSVVLVDTTADLYPPGLLPLGIDLSRTFVLRPSERDALPCLDEALRSKSVAASVGRIKCIGGTQSHRLRIAAQAGNGIGILVRPLAERGEISGASLRLHVSRGTDGTLHFEPLRLRGAIALSRPS